MSRKRRRRSYQETPEKRRARRLRWIKRTREWLRKFYGNRCNAPKCRKEGLLGRWEFAHLAPTKLMGRSRGRIERLLDVKNNPEKYTLMHRACHHDYDWGKVLERKKELESDEAPF